MEKYNNIEEWLEGEHNTRLTTSYEDEVQVSLVHWETKDNFEIVVLQDNKGNLYNGRPDENIWYNETDIAEDIARYIIDGEVSGDIYVACEDWMSDIMDELEDDYEQYQEEYEEYLEEEEI